MPKNKSDAEAPVRTEDVKEPAAASAAAKKNESGFYIYIGPNIKGLIQTGMVDTSSRTLAAALTPSENAITPTPVSTIRVS